MKIVKSKTKPIYMRALPGLFYGNMRSKKVVADINENKKLKKPELTRILPDFLIMRTDCLSERPKRK